MPEISIFRTIGVVFLYLGYLLLPGYIALCLAKIRRNRFLLGYGISFSLLILTQVPIKILGGSPALWFWSVHIAIAILLGASWVYGRCHNIATDVQKSSSRRAVQYVGFSAIVIGFSVYH